MKIKDDIRFRRMLDEGVVLLQEAGEVAVVNQVGIRVLELLDSGQDVSEIVALLVDEFEVEPDRLRHDVTQYIESLAQAGVIEL